MQEKINAIENLLIKKGEMSEEVANAIRLLKLARKRHYVDGHIEIASKGVMIYDGKALVLKVNW